MEDKNCILTIIQFEIAFVSRFVYELSAVESFACKIRTLSKRLNSMINLFNLSVILK
jgi:hypothetical protein